MKAFILMAGLISAFSAHALENGMYKNIDYKSEQAAMFKSVSLSADKCSDGGVIAKFYGADAINFCAGNLERRDFKYKKCIGKELPYPFGGCVGVKKTVTMTTIAEVTLDEKTGIISRIERNSTDDEVTFEQEFLLIPENGNLKVIKTFQSHTDGRSGQEEYSFIKE